MGLCTSLLCVCLGIYLGLWAGIRLYARFYQNFFLHHKDLVEGCALYLASLTGAGVLCGMSFIPVFVVAFWGFSGLALLTLAQSKISKKAKLAFDGLLCLGGVFALYPFFNGTALLGFLLAFLWLALWQIIVWFDRFPLTSLIVFLGWAIGLVSTGLLIRTLPSTVTSTACLLGVLTVVLGSFRSSQKQPTLGGLLSSLFGFMWAGVWVYFLNYGAVIQTVSGFGYYIFEFIFLVLAFFYHKPVQTILERLVAFPQLSSKTVKIVFSHVLILSFLAAMTIRMHMAVNSLVIFAIAVVLIDLYLRLNALENPVPTWRELLKNTHQGMKEFVHQVKTVHSKKKEVVPEKKKQQKTVVKKKTIKKKVMRKK